MTGITAARCSRCIFSKDFCTVESLASMRSGSMGESGSVGGTTKRLLNFRTVALTSICVISEVHVQALL